MGDVLGFKPTFIAYRGSAPAITDLLGGQVDLLWDQVTNAITQVQAGSLHGIAVTSPERLEQLKDVPTTAELGMPESATRCGTGSMSPRDTEGTVAALNAALRKALVRSGRAGEAEATRHLAVPGGGDDAGGACQAVRCGLAAGDEAGRELGDQAERGEVAPGPRKEWR